MFVIRRGMFLLSLTAACQVYTVSLKAGLYTYNRLARGALDTPEGETTQADPGVMGVAREAPTAATGGLVGKLKPKREDERQDELDKRLAIVHELKVSGFLLEIDRDGPIFTCPMGGFCHGSPR